ncbi:MAG: cupin domain-containing protein [Candidatus Dormibacteraeota bacterium]|nr:cupin domain-containing protein [Candidatus Dormibacteraeota bacterium]MBO0701380.1 cupin domain-containing protein [Candidatus Dormibacteraeota bacterium]
MGLVKLDVDADNLVTPQYSTARGPVMRSDQMELTRGFYEQGKGADTHAHPEEQIMYVLSGRGLVTLANERYEVGPGEVSYHPSNVPHSIVALEDLTVLSIKRLVSPIYEATGKLA